MCRPSTQNDLIEGDETQPSLASTFWKLRAIALIACCDEALFFFATGATHYPYLRTLVRCHTSTTDGFSGSARCGDADVVLARGARSGGWATLAVVVGNVVCILLWAPQIDAVGRRSAVVRSLVGLALGLLALGAAARADSAALSLGAYFVTATTSAMQAAAAALASDSCEKDAQRRALAVVGGARGAGTVLASAAGYVVLRRDLDNYALPYAVCAGLALVVALGARCALAQDAAAAQTERDWRRGARALGRSCRRAAVAVTGLYAAYYAGFSILSSWGISQLGMSQSTLSLVVLVQYAGLALGAAYPGQGGLVGGSLAIACGLAATGLAAPRVPQLVWALPFLAGAGLGAASTAASTAVGVNVPRRDQGQAQACLLLLGYVGAAAGCLAGPRLYAPGASVLRASLPFVVGAAAAAATALGLAAPRRTRGVLEEALLDEEDAAPADCE